MSSRPTVFANFATAPFFRRRNPGGSVALAVCLALASGGAVRAEAPTFARDVAPIFHARCTTCHRPGEVAPMSLISHEEARPWAKSIAKAVRSGDMPPWSGESDRVSWRNDLSLSEREIETVVAWAEAGAPLGDPADLPPTPVYPDGWKLGEPDHVVELSPVEVPPDGEDLFLQEKIRVELDGPKWISAIEFLPGDRRVTHHFQATYRTLSGDSPSKTLDPMVGGILAIWTAGMPPFEFPEGVGRPIGTSTEILVDSHYHPFGEGSTDRTRIGLHFGEGELKKEVATLAIANTGIRIPPGAPAHEEFGFNLLDRDARIVAFSPHMHVRGKAMRYDLVRPDGARETLLDVPKYDYDWQWQYYPTEPIDAPAGSRIEVTGVWDNSEANPANPDPSAEIRYRGDTLNEMFVGFVEVVPAEGVYHDPIPDMDKLKRLLSVHPPEETWLASGFLPFGIHAPREGKGRLYVARGLNMFSIDADEVSWEGDKLKIVAQMPTPEASAAESVFEGTRGPDGKIVGRFLYAAGHPRSMDLPVSAVPMTRFAAASGGAGR